MWHRGMYSMLTLPPSLKVLAAILQFQSEVTEALVSPGQIALIGKWMALTAGSWQMLVETWVILEKGSQEWLNGPRPFSSEKWLILLPVSNMDRAVGHGLIDGCHVNRSRKTVLWHYPLQLVLWTHIFDLCIHNHYVYKLNSWFFKQSKHCKNHSV